MRGMGTDAFFDPPANQPSAETAKTAQLDTSESVKQYAGKTANELVKATFYLTPDLVMKLEQVRLERLQRGQKIDKSALVREAIDRLAS